MAHQRHPSHSPQEPLLGDPKRPPGWNPATARDYPFKQWCKDLRSWVEYSTVLPHQQGHLIRAKMQGVAKQMLEEMDSNVLKNGGAFDFNDGRGLQVRTGVEVMLKILEGRFKEYDIETQLDAQDALNDFKRLGGESVDSTLARYELIRDQAFERAGHALAPGVETRQLFRVFGIPPQAQLRLLGDLKGNLPSNPVELADLKAQIRREAHWVGTGGVSGGVHAATTSGQRSYVATGAAVDNPWQAEAAPPDIGAVTLNDPAQAFQAGVQAAATMFQGGQARAPTFDPNSGAGNGQETWLNNRGNCMAISCASCGESYPAVTYWMDDDNSTETESDTAADPIDWSDMPSPVDANGNIDYNELFYQQKMTKRRFRSAMGRQPRRHRYKGSKGRRKGQGKGYRFKKKSGWTFMTDDGDQA